MTRTRKVRTDTKKYKAALDAFHKNVEAVLLRHGATRKAEHGLGHEYEVNTPAGILRVSMHGYAPTVFQQFEDVDRARKFAGNFGDMFNTYSGKWNFHWGCDHKPEEVRDPEFVTWWSVMFEWLMRQESVPAPVNRYEVVLGDRVLVNRLFSPAKGKEFITWVVSDSDVKNYASHLFPLDPDQYKVRKQKDPAAREVSRLGVFFTAAHLKADAEKNGRAVAAGT